MIACVTCHFTYSLMRHLFQHKVGQRITGTANGGLAGVRMSLAMETSYVDDSLCHIAILHIA